MAQASHHDSPGALHHPRPAERTKDRGSSLGLIAACVVLAVAAVVLGVMLSKQKATLADVRGQLDQANSETTTVKAGLAKANTRATDLQAQLDKAGSQQADLQGQVKKNATLAADLQAQLNKMRADARTQHAQAQTQVTDLQAQATAASGAASKLRKELDEAKSQAENLKSQLAKAKDATVVQPMAPVAAKPRPLPLTTEFKKSFWGGAFALQIKNQGFDPLNLDIKITGSDKTPSRSATLESGATLKVEEVAAGAQVVIASNGFESVNVTAQ